MNGYTNLPYVTGSATITTSGLCLTMNRWSFCPGCGTQLPVEWKHCAGCGKLIGAEIPQMTSGYVTTSPLTQWVYTTNNLLCTCQKCSPRCS